MDEEREEMQRENTMTITIARNSDGEILKVIQGISIFAGIANAEQEGGAFSLVLNEGSNGKETFCAAEAAENAIKAFEKENAQFKAIRGLKKAFDKLAEKIKEKTEDDE